MSIIDIELLPLNKNDSKLLYALFNDEKVLQSYRRESLLSQKQSDDFLQKITSRGCWTWKILNYKEKNSFLGICSLHHYDQENKTIEIGGTLFSIYWGKGIMVSAFIQLIEKARKEFNINKVIGKTHISNKKAIQMVHKLGFTILQKDDEEVVLIKEINQKTTSP
ncbi:MAG: GNAT family N-acetyltransferase [Flavobacteriales bacterium]|nr:GNAT family N-acetyltransferase [Flavobacteriales bacterium]